MLWWLVVVAALQNACSGLNRQVLFRYCFRHYLSNACIHVGTTLLRRWHRFGHDAKRMISDQIST
jgi:hypothetical protein